MRHKTTTNPDDPRLGRGIDAGPVEQNEAYLVLSERERAKGFVRPVRTVYRHVGPPGPQNPLRDLTPEEVARFAPTGIGYSGYEAYPEGGAKVGRFWTREDLDAAGKGCQAETIMALDLAQTYARQPDFYGATYCVRCRKHLAVNEFAWVPDGSPVGS